MPKGFNIIDESGNPVTTKDEGSGVRSLDVNIRSGFNLGLDGELEVKSPSQILLDEHFDTSPINTNRWTDITVGSGTISINTSASRLELTNTTVSGDSALIHSNQNFTNIFSKTYTLVVGIILTQETENNNERIWGVREDGTNNGVYFLLENGILKATTELNGSRTSTDINSFKPTDGNLHRYKVVYRNYKVFFLLDEVLMHTIDILGTTATPLFATEKLNVWLANTNTGITSTSVDLLVEGIALFDDATSSISISGVDDNGLRHAVAVSPSRRLLVSQETPTPPPATTRVERVAYDAVAVSDDDVFVIPNGETLTLQRFAGAGEVEPSNGSVIELWDDPNGDGSVLNIIESIFVSGNGDQRDLNNTFLGDGTRAIRMRRLRLSGGSKILFGRWEGYY